MTGQIRVVPRATRVSAVRRLRGVHQGRGRRSATRVRGLAVGAVSATMAVLAHGGASGGLPDGTGAFLLLGLSAILAVAATSMPMLRTSRFGLFALLIGGQLAGHEVLAVAGHSHGAPSTAMFGAHAAAVLICGLLIALAERIGPRCAAALGRVLPRLFPSLPAVPLLQVLPQCLDLPTQLAAVLGASVSRRGPPLTV